LARQAILFGLAQLASEVYTQFLGPQPDVTLRCTNEGRRLLFHIQEQGQGNGRLDAVLVWSSSNGKPLWGFASRPSSLPTGQLHTVEYGRLPPCPEPWLRSVTQAFPPHAKRPRPIRGERICVSLNYQYDWQAQPCGTTKVFCFDLGMDGSIRRFADDRRMEMPPAVRAVWLKMLGPTDWRAELRLIESESHAGPVGATDRPAQK
jgi:hypothetical protein